ncbi:MSHA biogenesis protein MshJ [Marinimicrobium sp. ABcell2]|uniref:MSHA biogenesis protein MshJ n=1 Tax=Marinimicrobium sp. ABcell2 TaxID=3069751 RepID=UPI0027B183A1|nr:MSHA biogenesis protein MshJ [Marinimicrobium sp. ABcell2]MDQ2075220.1 MSHA biogenesis protein MshJ [Marinimicrobium sp. ABcell2]
MSPKLNELIEKIDAYSLRERVLLLLCALAVLVGIWQLAIEMPQERKRAQLTAELERISTAQSAQATQIAALSSALGQTVNGEVFAEREALRARLLTLDDELAALSQGLVSADQLPRILQDVLVSTTRLTLQRVQTHPVQELPLLGGGEEGRSTGVYKHSVTLRVTGSYFEVLGFLQSLEELPWRFYWDRLDYKVQGYPRGEIDIRVYTLSAEEGLLGV